MNFQTFTTGTLQRQEQARVTLPCLVRLAEAQRTIAYSDLAEHVGISNNRLVGKVLGEIGGALVDIAREGRLSPPPIQCLVVNKASGLPGAGIKWFTDVDYDTLTKEQQRRWAERAADRVFTYEHWSQVLERVSLEPFHEDFSSAVNVATASDGRGGGEGTEHLDLKVFIANHPELLGLPRRTSKGDQEYRLPSGDSIDVLFKIKQELVAVEVKSHISSDGDISRGIFQCVKYKAVLEAVQLTEGGVRTAQAILVFGGELPESLIGLSSLLGVHVVDGVIPS